ncbi:MAG TPA: extracellular solute-binding protein, partial [Candidatus Scybalocola faecipullorum]|nr:extracellular solute-binding protein [Candidatus Scybalocola faecipullorum]
MKFRRLLSAGLCLAMTAGFMTGCQTVQAQGGTSAATQAAADSESASEGVTWSENLLDPANPVTVKFYSYSYASPAFGTGFQTMMDNFNNGIGKEKGVILEFVADDTGTKAETDVKAGQQVDIVQSGFAIIDGNRDNLGISAFEDVFQADEMEAHFEGIPENCLNLGRIDGKMYGLAFTFSTPMLYVNGDLLEEAGLDPTQAPKDWDEMYDWCVQIKEATGKYGLALSPSNSSGWVTDSILYSNGATVLNEDRSAVEFASEEGVKAFESWKRFYMDGVAVGGTDTEAMQAFAAGEAAMHIQSTSVYTSFVSAAQTGGWTLYGYPMPGFDGNPSIPTNSGSAIVVRPDSEQKAQAIWEVIKYVTGDEGYTIITSEIGYLPLRPYLAEDENYLKGFVDENPIIKANIERLADIQPASIWPGDHATELATLYGDMAVKALTTDADIA